MNAASSHRIDQADIRFLVDKNADGIIVVDREGRVLFVNPAAEQIFGRTGDVLIGSPIGIPVIAGETTEITILRPDGEPVEAEIRIVETIWDQRPALLASLRDVSARKAVEERLRQSAKMEAVGRLTAGIAHDFNNLLTVVLGNLESAQRQSEMAASTRMQALENATRGAQRAATLTERLLAFARRKPLDPHVVDVNEIVAGMSELLQRTLGEQITIRTALDAEAWPIEADPTELEAAIVNLAVNARDAMPAGGELVIETDNVELDSAYAAANAEVAAGPHVMIAIADTGMGMTADVLNRVFEPFFTTKAEGRGTGLGLSQVYGFVKQSGGHVKLYSEPTMGTTAKIYLPKASTARVTTNRRIDECKRSDDVPHGRPGETILVVEDDPDVRAYTVGSLRELGYTVLEAGDAAAALDILRHEPPIQLLFTDLGLPGGMDGKTLADRARGMCPALKVVITTAYAGSVLVRDGRLAAGVQLLSKPFTLPALASHIRRSLDHRNLHQQSSRILVVDDEVFIRMLMVDALAEAGLQAEQAGNFQEALTKIRSVGELAGAVIDLGLPDQPGDGLVREIRALWPQLPVVVATGYLDDEVRRRFAPDSLLHMVTKPFDTGAVIEALKQLGLQSPTDKPA